MRLPSPRRLSLSSSPTTRPRLAPLSPTRPATGAPKLAGVIFDVDGTLTLPQPWMFSAMRRAAAVPDSLDILTHIGTLPAPAAAAAMAAVQDIETQAMAEARTQPGLHVLLKHLQQRGVRMGILTRNCDGPVQVLLEREALARGVFEPVVTRAFVPTKPRPEGIWHICETWGVGVENVVMVGDSMDDMAAGRAAGAVTVLVRNERNKELGEGSRWADVVVGRLDELVDVLEAGVEEVVREVDGGEGAEEVQEAVKEEAEAVLRN
ncbi:putative HAD superfamily hydrolase [Geopyxis carbonaria]|nr:putative HAD superfamily hydrolase [Geopyxis carbonaria]